jgi:hypothetical protein
MRKIWALRMVDFSPTESREETIPYSRRTDTEDKGVTIVFSRRTDTEDKKRIAKTISVRGHAFTEIE